jgi:hypothetical protein
LQHHYSPVIADGRFDLCRVLFLMGMQHMKKDRGFCLLSLAVACVVPCAAQADQSDAKGFVEDSSLNIFTRNAYFGRDRKKAQDKAEWGESFIAKYHSGFTQGTVGVGLDLLGQYALRLDTGRGRNNSGIAFFPVKGNDPATGTNDGSEPDIAKAGAAIKFRVSNTVLTYGDQLPALPVVHFDPTRLLPETFTGTSVSSDEIKDLHLDFGRFTRDSARNASARDSARLKSIDFAGGTYRFSPGLTTALYFSNIEDVASKKYININYVHPLDKMQSVVVDFNMYDTHYDSDYTKDGSQKNDIWSLATTYNLGGHSFSVSYQQNTGSRGYDYNIGDGGTIYMANSYFSDFNLEDERSWQISYEYNFVGLGMPGLVYKSAYVRGDNVTTDKATGGREREFYNQVSYTVQSGPAKKLALRLRSSLYRADDAVNAYYSPDMNEVRVFADYPINIF